MGSLLGTNKRSLKFFFPIAASTAYCFYNSGIKRSMSSDIMGFSLGFSVLHFVTGIHCKSRPLDHKITSCWRKDCIVQWGTMSSPEEQLIRHSRDAVAIETLTNS